MKPSDALALGRHLIKPKKGVVLDGLGSGCALGMIYSAAPAEETKHIGEFQGTFISECPCGCFPGPVSVETIIAHIFDMHVMEKVMDYYCKFWTIESIIDWLQTIEGAMGYKDVEETRECAPTHEDRTLVAHS